MSSPNFPLSNITDALTGLPEGPTSAMPLLNSANLKSSTIYMEKGDRQPHADLPDRIPRPRQFQIIPEGLDEKPTISAPTDEELYGSSAGVPYFTEPTPTTVDSAETDKKPDRDDWVKTLRERMYEAEQKQDTVFSAVNPGSQIDRQVVKKIERRTFRQRATRLGSFVNEKLISYTTPLKSRLMTLNEKGVERKGVIATAAGAVALIGGGYLIYKGMHDVSVHDTTPVSHGVGMHAGGDTIPTTSVTPPKSVTTLPSGSGHGAVPAHHVASSNVITVHAGDGIGDVINAEAKLRGKHLSGPQIYRLYNMMHQHFGNHFLNQGVYQMPNGDLGLSHTGPVHFTGPAQTFFDKFLQGNK